MGKEAVEDKALRPHFETTFLYETILELLSQKAIWMEMTMSMMPEIQQYRHT